MKVISHANGQFTVEACLSHYGHRRDLRYIWLSKKKRQEIVAKLKGGVTMDSVLEQIREAVFTSFSRDHLADRQDIANIARANHIDDIQRHPNDMTSVLSWIEEWKANEDNPVLFYKLQGNRKFLNAFLCCLKGYAILTLTNCLFLTLDNVAN